MPRTHEDHPSQDRKNRLAALIKKRRRQLHLRLADLRDLGGPTGQTAGEYEHGRIGKSHPETLLKFDTALRWKPGSSQAVLDGGEPVEVDYAGERDTVRQLKAAMTMDGRVDSDNWTPMLRGLIQDIFDDASKLVILTGLVPCSADVAVMAGHVHHHASYMLALDKAAEHGDDELLILMDSWMAERNAEDE